MIEIFLLISTYCILRHVQGVENLARNTANWPGIIHSPQRVKSNKKGFRSRLFVEKYQFQCKHNSKAPEYAYIISEFGFHTQILFWLCIYLCCLIFSISLYVPLPIQNIPLATVAANFGCSYAYFHPSLAWCVANLREICLCRAYYFQLTNASTRSMSRPRDFFWAKILAAICTPPTILEVNIDTWRNNVLWMKTLIASR